MDQIGTFLSQYATKEVLSVLGAVAVAFAGWKAAKGTWGMVGGMMKKASFLGLAAAALFAVGLGATGLGIGELSSRPETKTAPSQGLTNADLLAMVKADKSNNPETLKAVLDYANKRDQGAQALPVATPATIPVEDVAYKIDGDKIVAVNLKGKDVIPASYDQFTIDPVKEAAVKAEESVMSLPYAWAMILLGLGTTVTGATVFFTRHNKRNPDDPNHPNYEAQYARR